MPSVTAMVLNSTGVPPAAQMPSAASRASARKLRLHGLTSDQVCTTATSGFLIASSSMPVARNIARAGARSGPLLIRSLRIVVSSATDALAGEEHRLRRRIERGDHGVADVVRRRLATEVARARPPREYLGNRRLDDGCLVFQLQRMP